MKGSCTQSNSRRSTSATKYLVSLGSGPARLWNWVAPPELVMDDGWLTWAHEALYIDSHKLQTQGWALRPRATMIGFVGHARLCAEPWSPKECLHHWHALGVGATRLVGVE